MSKEDLGDLDAGSNIKYVLEGRDKDEASIFLKSLDLRDTVRLQRLHQDSHIKWIGGRFDRGLDVLDEQSVIGAKGSGCLEIVDMDSYTIIFMKQGKIVKEHREGANGVDPRQSKMNI